MFLNSGACLILYGRGRMAALITMDSVCSIGVDCLVSHKDGDVTLRMHSVKRA